MMSTTATAESRARGRHVQQRARAAATPPPLLTFRMPDGQIGHARCGSSLEFQGGRAQLELDFYCPHCVEHVTLPECILSRIPFGAVISRS
jgi:hypothetical protein